MARRKRGLTELQQESVKIWLSALAAGAEQNHHKRLENLEKGRVWTDERRAAAAKRMKAAWTPERRAQAALRVKARWEKAKQAFVSAE